MKLTTAALVLLLSTPSAAAFTPSKQHVFRSSRFGVRRQKNAWSLSSATVDREDLDVATSSAPDIYKMIEQHAALQAPEPAAPVAPQTAEQVRLSTRAYLSRYQGQSGASLVYSKLQEYGVTVVNGYSGGANLPLLDQFHVDHPRHVNALKEPIRWITNSNESSAGHIAEGYAKSQPLQPGELPIGVAIATSGPGVTNLITPLQDGICDGVPMLVMCGQAATTAPEDAFQSAPAVQMTAPCTKWSYQIKSAAEIPMVMDYAFFIARNGRPGPVFVDLPKDLQNQILTPELIDSFAENTISETNNDETSFARMITQTLPDGRTSKSIHLGEAGKGLPFGIAQDGGQLKVKPVIRPKEVTAYHADHHTSNKIFKQDSSVINSRAVRKQGTIEAAVEATVGNLEPTSFLMKELKKIIRNAKKPVIIAGQGCNDCPDELRAFAERLNIPVTSTLHALGCFDERHELALNMMGMHGHPTPNFMVQKSDLIICIGSRFDDRITGRASDFVPEAKQAAIEGRGGIVHVDIRLSERAKQVEPTYFVHSTGKKFLQTMNAAFEDDDTVRPTQTKAWVEHMKELQRDFPVKVPKFPTREVIVEDPESGNKLALPRTRMSAQYVISELNRQLLAADKMDEAIFSTGVGIHQMVAAQLLTWTRPRQMLSSGSLGTMGVALGYAIGAKLANGGKIVIAVDGDGSFNMTFTELKTVAEQKIPVKIIILDNEAQMMVEYWQRLFHDGRYLAVRNEKNPDYTILADAFGIKSVFCDCEEELEEKMSEFLFADPDEPVLFHVRIERTPCLPLVAPGEALQEMILEDCDFDVDPGAAPS